MATETISEEDSILNNLSKTRELWSSKADLGPSTCPFPKSPTSVSSAPNNKRNSSSSEPVSTEVVKADEQVIEDYELPDIKSIKSQFDVGPTAPVPVPIQRTPSVKTNRNQPASNIPEQIPVNREEQEEESYDVELGKLKAQFEAAAKNAISQKPVQRSTSVPKAAIKDHVTKFEDEISQQKKPVEIAPEQRTAEEPVPVDLRSLKSQFEREDERPINPLTQNPSTRKRSSLSVSSGPSSFVENGISSPPEIVRHEDQPEEEHYDVELGALKKRFESKESSSQPTTPRKSSMTTIKKQPQPSSPRVENKDKQETQTDAKDSPRAEPVKSYEPVYDEMIGEQSVKDRLQRFLSIAESPKKETPVKRRPSQKKVSSPVAKEPEPAAVVYEEAPSKEEVEIVRPPPAGSKITPDYVPTVDLQQTKALFEKEEPKHRRSTYKRSSSSSGSVTPTRVGRSSETSDKARRSSSYHSSASPSGRSAQSSSPARGSVGTEQARSPSVSSETDMSQIVKPQPAGTKETPDYVPSMNINSVKSMFEKPKKDPTSPSSEGGAPRRRRPLNSTWLNGNESEANKSEEDGGRKVVTEGSYEERAGDTEEGIVRPPTAGTKERPAYCLSCDFLKSRAAMFDGPKEQSYKPRNKIASPEKPKHAEIVNQGGESEEVGYKLSENQLKDRRNIFEGGGAVTPTKQEPVRKTTEISQTPSGEIVRPPPAGTRDECDIVHAADIGSTKKLFEGGQVDQPEPAPRKQPINIKEEAMEAVNRDREVQQTRQEPAAEIAANEESKESESETEGEYLLDKEQKQQAQEEVEPAAEEEEEEEEAAAVTPVRVAVPDSPEPKEEEEQQQLDEQKYEEPFEQPEVPNQVEDHQEEEDKPEESRAENIIIDDHLLRESQENLEDQTPPEEPSYTEDKQEVEEERPQEEEQYAPDPEQDKPVEDETNYGQSEANEVQEPQYEEEVNDKYSQPDPAPEKPASVAENGGLVIAQEAGDGSYLE